MAMHANKEIRAFGIRVLLSRHPEVRKLKQDNIPSHHGNKFWTSSWLLMDYFRRRGLPKRAHVMDVGCGWGLAGIYCAKRHGAVVTGVDIDTEVFPFLRLHAEINGVRITTMRKSFQGLTENHLQNVDVLLGADICFWDSMIDPLKKLIRRALRAGVDTVLIADPGRTTFDRLGEHLCEELKGEILDWEVRRPRRIEGQILRVTNGG
ncbi:MAG: methyltransferase domain-containing protein [Desulfobacteraceae bacterium]